MTDVSTDTVLATGTTTSRALNARFSDNLNLLDFGADPTGASDSTTAVQNWLNATTTHNKAGYAPAGTYSIDGAVSLPTGNFTIYGDPGCTEFVCIGSGQFSATSLGIMNII